MALPAKTFQDLLVWQKAHQLVLEVYKLTAKFPNSEVYALTSQCRRAAVSIPANIAEGFTKSTKPEKIRYLNISQGSLEEMRYYLVLAADLGYAQTAESVSLLEEVSKFLNRYKNAVSRNDFHS